MRRHETPLRVVLYRGSSASSGSHLSLRDVLIAYDARHNALITAINQLAESQDRLASSLCASQDRFASSLSASLVHLTEQLAASQHQIQQQINMLAAGQQQLVAGQQQLAAALAAFITHSTPSPSAP
eukprot:TRINITY_DN9799_c0_g1_i4.p1 TRINITY_DN9799_c0_g1~~TRINITY_DN9799_c0_g1_i4.p1  ORF type:complete len:127 (+),score=18.80 TRINITY_DN9799_c0_g1_i4:47-427(+)